MNVKKVLLVEDYPSLQVVLPDCVKVVFGKDVVVLVSGTLCDAEATFQRHAHELDFILMDTSLGRGVNTFDFVSRISKVFKQPIVAISTDELHRKKMVELGCTHGCPKSELREFLEGWKDK
jgi:CheY-like chemotaxis protein